MAVVNLKIAGKDYQVACDNGQEEHLRFLADDIDERIGQMAFNMGGNLSEPMGLLMAALTLADELAENKEEIKQLNRQARQDQQHVQDSRMLEMETAMAVTLEEIATRIEKIADQIEVG